jgi:hypothetical protein
VLRCDFRASLVRPRMAPDLCICRSGSLQRSLYIATLAIAERHQRRVELSGRQTRTATGGSRPTCHLVPRSLTAPLVVAGTPSSRKLGLPLIETLHFCSAARRPPSGSPGCGRRLSRGSRLAPRAVRALHGDPFARW